MATLPDFVLIMTDQQRFDQIGYESGGHYETPRLDALAREGVVFANAYSGSTTCVPARASLLTGLHHHRVLTQMNRLALREGFWTVAHALRQVGYQTALVGKMHFAPVRAQHGFDTMRLCEHLGAKELRRPSGRRREDVDDYHQWLFERGLRDWRADVPGGPATPGRPPDINGGFPYSGELHPTRWVETEALSVLANRDPDRPLLLVVSFPHPHAPYNPPEPYWSMYDADHEVLPTEGFEVNDRLPPAFAEALRREVGAFRPLRVDHNERVARRWLSCVRALIKQIDDAIGSLLARIDLSRTTVFFTSDHGDYAGHRGLLKKVPWIPFDDLARVPMVVAGAGVVGGRRLSSLVQNCDFALTCLDYAGVEVPRERFDTASIRSLLEDRPDRFTRDRAVLCATSAGWPMVRQHQFKYVLHEHSRTDVLFNLESDPGETTNLAGDLSSRAIAKELSTTLTRELSRAIPSLPPVGAPTNGRARAARLNVPARFVRGAFDDHGESMRSAVWLIRHICEHIGIEDFSETEVLDFGCGVKLTEALVNYALPIKQYVGVDVYEDMIEFLRTQVRDDRFEYFHVDIHNVLYNPDGKPLAPGDALPLDGRRFDLIALLSVFTHLEPSDYRNLLLLLRRYARGATRLVYSLYIDELTDSGHGLMDAWARTIAEDRGRLGDAVADNVDVKTGARRIEPFKDLDPSRPLRWAVYSESYARELIEGTGWRVLSLSPPDTYIQHHFVCAPA